MKRDKNEDNLLVFPEQNVFAVFDGMGGHAAGEVANGGVDNVTVIPAQYQPN